MTFTSMTKSTVFAQPARALRDVKDECILILDTNVLLLPYNISEQNTRQILQIYTLLVGRKKLFIPRQVVEEFDQNRVRKLTDLIGQITQKRDSAQGLYKGKSLLLESLPIYQEIIRIEKEIDSHLKQYRKKVGELLEIISEWNEGDPLTKMYQAVFERAIFDPRFDFEEIKKEFQQRIENHIPPGYKDASKGNGGAGDYIIWKTILKIAENYKQNVIFVTGDEKADWWHRAQKQPLYPRQELVKEFKQHSGGLSFYMIRFPEFLSLFGANESLVQEARVTDVSPREVEILNFVQQGLKNDDIAKKLGLGGGTVRNYLLSINKKLGTNNKAGALQKAIECGLINPVHSLRKDEVPLLSSQEIIALRFVQQGLSNQKIAESMGKGVGTVRNYLLSVQKKLKAKNRVHAVQKGIEYGILFPT